MATERLILAADVGGTNLSLGLMAGVPGRVRLLRKAAFATAGTTGLEAPARSFLRDCAAAGLGRPEACCVSAAGPLRGRVIALTNAAWDIDAEALETALGCPVKLVNDFTAVAHGVLLLDPADPDQLLPLPHPDGSRPAFDPAGPAVVVGAGTGLGVGYITRDAGAPVVHASEGGHLGLPVTGPETLELWQYLAAREPGPPGAELAVSGPGIATLFEFLLATGRAPATPATRSIQALPPTQRPQAIAQGLQEPACRHALDLFVELYARVCADLAAVFLPTGGLFLAGGIAGKNAALFQDGHRFTRAFGRNYRPHIDAICRATPVHIVRDYAVSLYGAADAALRP